MNDTSTARPGRAIDRIPHLATGPSVMRYDLGDAIARQAGTPVTPTACGEPDVTCTLTTRRLDKVRCQPCLVASRVELTDEQRTFLGQVARGVVHELPSGEAREHHPDGSYNNADEMVFWAKRAGLIQLAGVITNGQYKHPRARSKMWQLTRAGEVAIADPVALLTPDQLEEIFHNALGSGDAKGVEAALMLLVTKDPRRAEKLFELTRTALTIVRAGRGEDPTDPTEES